MLKMFAYFVCLAVAALCLWWADVGIDFMASWKIALAGIITVVGAKVLFD